MSNRIAAHQQPQSAPLLVSAQLSGPHLGQQAPVDQLSSAARARAHASLTPAIDLHAAYRLCPSHPGPSSKPVAERWSMNRGGAGRSSVWRNEASLDCCQRTTRSLEATDAACHTPSRSMAHCTKLLWFACCKERTERNK